jgi:hypothetical protein
MNNEPTDEEYARYYELCEPSEEGDDLTDDEAQELQRLKSLVHPWQYTIDVHELAIENHGLIAVSEELDSGLIYTHWISELFAVIPQHWQREIDGHTRFIWAVLPLNDEPVYACSLFFEDGKFRRDRPELLDWPFNLWIYHSIKARRAYRQHFGSEFPKFPSGVCGEGDIDKWIGQLNI